MATREVDDFLHSRLASNAREDREDAVRLAVQAIRQDGAYEGYSHALRALGAVYMELESDPRQGRGVRSGKRVVAIQALEIVRASGCPAPQWAVQQRALAHGVTGTDPEEPR